MDYEDFADFEDDLFGNDNDNNQDKPDQEMNDDDVLSNVIKKTEGKSEGKKKRNLKPRPTLTEHALTGPKGLCALRKLFEKWQPHEKKSPYDNLDDMMQKVEYWGHILYPKSTFDDVISKVEHLGRKRAVKVYMTKLRLGMPLFEEMDETEGEKIGNLKSPVKEQDKPFSPLPDDDFFDDDDWVMKSPSPADGQSKNSVAEKRIAVDSDDSDAEQDVEKENTKPAPKKRLLIDSDDSDAEQDGMKEATKPAPQKQITIDSDESDIEEDGKKEATNSAAKKRMIIDSDDSDAEDDSKKGATNPTPKKRRIILDSEDSDEEENIEIEATNNAKELSPEAALDMIFDE